MKASLMEIWVVNRESGRVEKIQNFDNYSRTDKMRRALTKNGSNHRSINSTSSNDDLFQQVQVMLMYLAILLILLVIFKL